MSKDTRTEAPEAAGREGVRIKLFDLWLRFGSSIESDSSEGWELADKILDEFDVQPRTGEADHA